MSIRKLLRMPPSEVNNPNYYVLLESHIPYLRVLDNSRVTPLPHVCAKYKGDFHGLLNTLNIEKNFHYVLTRLNGFSKSQDYDGEMIELIIPAKEAITRFIATFKSKQV